MTEAGPTNLTAGTAEQNITELSGGHQDDDDDDENSIRKLVFGSYRITLIKQTNGKFKVSYHQEAGPPDHSYTVSPHESKNSKPSGKKLWGRNSKPQKEIQGLDDVLNHVQWKQSELDGDVVLEDLTFIDDDDETTNDCTPQNLDNKTLVGSVVEIQSEVKLEPEPEPKREPKPKQKRLKCKIDGCRQKFAKKHELAEHLKEIHGIEEPEVPENIPEPPRVVYELKCGNCSKIYWCKISHTHIHLKDYLEEGVSIFCLNCQTIADASVTLSDRAEQDCSQEMPLLRCKNPECSRKEQMFATFKSLGGHKNTCHPKTTTFMEPETITCRKRRRRRHYVSDSERIVKSFPCRHPGCLKQFDLKRHFENHVKKFHEPGATKRCLCIGCNPHRAKKRPSYFVKCAECQKEFVINLGPKSQLMKKPGVNIRCLSCKTDTTLATLVKCDIRQPSTSGILFLCDEPNCPAEPFVSMRKFGVHLDHHSKESVKCDLCGVLVRNMAVLHHHRKKCKAIGDPCPCQICEKICVNKYDLIEHIRRRHYEQKNLCEECGLSFASPLNLRNHIKSLHLKHRKNPTKIKKTHVEKCIPCDLPNCNKLFTTRKLMRQHVRNFHIEKDLKCDLCPRIFKTKLQVQRHRKRHFNSNRVQYFNDGNSHLVELMLNDVKNQEKKDLEEDEARELSESEIEVFTTTQKLEEQMDL